MRGTPFYNPGFAGLNTRDSQYSTPGGQARDLRNVRGTLEGALRKREGSTALATTAAQITSLAAAETVSPACLVAASGPSIYQVDGGGIITSLYSAGTAGSRWAFVQAPTSGGQGPVYAMNGVDAPQQWTGTGATAAWTAATGTLPNGKYMVFAGGRLFVAGMSASAGVTDPGSAVVFSNLYDPRDWPVPNIVQFDPNDGDAITGLGTIGPYLLVFKRRKTFVVYDTDTGANRRLSDNTGCAAPRSIVETPSGTFFLTLDRGVYSTDGHTLKNVSDIIRGTTDTIIDSTRANACAAFHNNRYLLSVGLTAPSGTAGTYTLDYDVALDGWWLHTIAVNQFAVWKRANGQELYGAALGASRIDRQFVPNVYTDNGAGYAAWWTGAWQSPSYFRRRIIQTPDYRKRLRQVRLNGSGKFGLFLATDFGGQPTLVKTFDFTAGGTTFGGSDTFGGGGTYGDPAASFPARAYSLGVANAFSLQWISDVSSTQPWQLDTFEMFITDRSD